jgi:hypothetical protein
LARGDPRADVAVPRSTVDIRQPPSELDPLVEWIDAVSQNLVLLEPYSLDDLRRAVAAVEAALDGHIAVPVPPTVETPRADELRADHLRYRVSLEELRGLLRVVENDDHGGHRQALGQYGRVLAESVRRHRASESSAPRETNAGRSRNSN